jgi:PAS domain S-box-containing protein
MQREVPLERFIEAFDAELDYVAASLRRLGARPTEIEDLAHEVFLGLVRTRQSLADRRSFRLLLFGLAVRAIVRHRRRAGGAPKGGLESVPLTLAALDRVALKRRAVLVLHELEEVPVAEIAASLSMTRLGVAVRLRRARRELEGALRQLAADWQVGRFGRSDLLLAALGAGESNVLFSGGWAEEGRADIWMQDVPGVDGKERPWQAVGQVRQLQDDIFLLEMVMDDIPETIYFKDRDSRFTHINRRAAAHYGIGSPDLAVGRTDFDFFTDEHAHQALRDEQEIIRTGRPLVSIEEQETLPDGKLRRVSTTKLPLHDGDGEIVGTFGLSRDINHRRAV